MINRFLLAAAALQIVIQKLTYDGGIRSNLITELLQESKPQQVDIQNEVPFQRLYTSIEAVLLQRLVLQQYEQKRGLYSKPSFPLEESAFLAGAPTGTQYHKLIGMPDRHKGIKPLLPV